jgi:hypothetical protein
MRLYPSIYDLEYYNRYEPLPCYADSILQPNDILLQANGFVGSGAFTLAVFACDITGAVQETVTSNFTYSFRSIVIGGLTYYYCNLRADTYSTYMTANRCFTLKVVITDTTTSEVVYTRWTQQYKIATFSTAVAPTVFRDGELLEPCVPFDNPILCGIQAGSLLRFEVTFDCLDSFSGDIYAEGDVLTSVGELFTYTRFSYIPSRLRPIPNEINRTVSKNCRTQRTQIKPSLQFFGTTHFPSWKMGDIEGMFLANKLYIEGEQYEADGGVYFEEVGTPKNCEYIYKFNSIVNKCLQWQIFGCVPNCESLASYYLFPDEFTRLYDDALRPIADDKTELELYFRSIEGTTFAGEMPFTLQCQPYAVFKVISSGVLPKFIYVDNLFPNNRIYPRTLPINAVNLNSLCNGVTTNNQVPIVVVTGYDSNDINVPLVDVTGYDSVSANAETIQVTAGANFTVQGTFTSATNYEGQGVLNLSLSTANVSPYISEVIATIGVEGRPSRDIMITDTDNGNMPVSSILIIGADGSLTYTGTSTSNQGNNYYVELFMIRYPL